MKLFINAVLIVITLSFVTLAQTQSANQVAFEKDKHINLTDEDLIREIIFREILETPCSNSDKSSKVYYLSIAGGKDPSEGLLKKLADCKIILKKMSESIISADDSRAFSEILPNREDILFSVSKLDWQNKNEVKATATRGTDNLGSNGYTYILKKEKGKWKIVSVESCFVS